MTQREKRTSLQMKRPAMIRAGQFVSVILIALHLRAALLTVIRLLTVCPRKELQTSHSFGAPPFLLCSPVPATSHSLLIICATSTICYSLVIIIAPQCIFVNSFFEYSEPLPINSQSRTTSRAFPLLTELRLLMWEEVTLLHNILDIGIHFYKQAWQMYSYIQDAVWTVTRISLQKEKNRVQCCLSIKLTKNAKHWEKESTSDRNLTERFPAVRRRLRGNGGEQVEDGFGVAELSFG